MRSTIEQDEIPLHRTWQGRRLTHVEEMMMYLDKMGPVRETYERLCQNLDSAGIDYVLIGAIALAAHKFERGTTDIDMCVRAEGLDRFRQTLVGTEYQNIAGRARRFFDPKTQVTIDLLVSGQLAGKTEKNQSVRFPDPSEGRMIQNIKTVPLERLIELKLVTWRLKDWADVVALIRENTLSESFSDRLDPLVRTPFLQCYDNMVEEDRYSPERDDPPQ